MNTTTVNKIEFTRINNDVNGNPRYVCHFLNFINSNEEIDFRFKYGIALSRSRQLGGKKFHNKQYGGGIVFQMYSGEEIEMSAKIQEIANKYNPTNK